VIQTGRSPKEAAYMERALFHAARGLGRTSPNPLVGAIVVSADGVVVGQGYHHRAGEAHAEVNALDEAGGRARGATLYCTLEPCAHHGRTPPCVHRVLEAGTRRVVAATEDPNPIVSGRGFAFLREHGVHVEVGLGADASASLNRPFFTLMREGRPFVILKAAASLDGRIAETSGRRTFLTSAAANRHAHCVRAQVDAIAVGVGTVLADDPELTARGIFRERPLLRVIFDRRLRTPPDAKVLSTLSAGPVMIVSTPEASRCAELRKPLEDAGATIDASGDGLRGTFQRLAAGQQIGSLLLEGGAAMHTAAWDEGLVDYVRLYVTPHVLGNGGVELLSGRGFSSAALFERRVESLGPDVVIEGYVHRAG